MVYWIVLAIVWYCVCLEGVLPALYSPRGRVTSRLDLGDNRKVITDYRNHGIKCIIKDLVVSSGYLPGVLRDTPSSAVLRKASSCGLDHPWGRSPCSLPWVSRVVPPTILHRDGWLGEHSPSTLGTPLVNSSLELSFGTHSGFLLIVKQVWAHHTQQV